MTTEVRVIEQDRQDLALRATPGGLVALVPRGVDPDSVEVRTFIERGLSRLPDTVGTEGSLTPDELRDLVAIWAERIGVGFTRVAIRKMRTKWASCSSLGTITLSHDVLRLPVELVNYVICHELAHVLIPGHGKGWQAVMGIHIPDWREREKRLAGWAVG